MGQKNVHRACVLMLASCLLIVVAAWSEIRPFIEALSGIGPSFVEPLATSLTFPNGGDAIGLAKGDFNADGNLM